MSSRDKRFSKDSQYREISDRDLFYDLEYTLIEEKSTEFNAPTIMLYTFFTSLVLNYYFFINQLYTIVTIAIYLILFQFARSFLNLRRRIFGLIIIMVANITDHILSDLTILPGNITNENFTMLTWIFEIGWVFLFGLEFLTIFAPVQQPVTPGRTILPATETTEKHYNGLSMRVEGSKYAITDIEEDVDTSLLQESFRNLTQYILTAFVIIVLLDLFVWEIISMFAGGDNIDEEYFVSGMSFIVFTLLVIYGGLFFNGNSEEKNL